MLDTKLNIPEEADHISAYAEDIFLFLKKYLPSINAAKYRNDINSEYFKNDSQYYSVKVRLIGGKTFIKIKDNQDKVGFSNLPQFTLPSDSEIVKQKLKELFHIKDDIDFTNLDEKHLILIADIKSQFSDYIYSEKVTKNRYAFLTIFDTIYSPFWFTKDSEGFSF